jgi:hypothetical protein
MKCFKGVTTLSSSGWFGNLYVAVAAVLVICVARTQADEVADDVADEVADESPPPTTHAHGRAKLRLVVQGQRLAIAFDSPAVNLIGFEHAPQSEAEQRTASYAKGQLQQAPRLFITSPGANCRLFSAKVDEPHWDREADHYDYRARYVFQCQRPQRLQSIDVQLINQLAPGTKLKTEVVVGNSQQSMELSASLTTVRIQQ